MRFGVVAATALCGRFTRSVRASKLPDKLQRVSAIHAGERRVQGLHHVGTRQHAQVCGPERVGRRRGARAVGAPCSEDVFGGVWHVHDDGCTARGNRPGDEPGCGFVSQGAQVFGRGESGSRDAETVWVLRHRIPEFANPRWVCGAAAEAGWGVGTDGRRSVRVVQPRLSNVRTAAGEPDRQIRQVLRTKFRGHRPAAQRPCAQQQYLRSDHTVREREHAAVCRRRADVHADQVGR